MNNKEETLKRILFLTVVLTLVEVSAITTWVYHAYNDKQEYLIHLDIKEEDNYSILEKPCKELIPINEENSIPDEKILPDVFVQKIVKDNRIIQDKSKTKYNDHMQQLDLLVY